MGLIEHQPHDTSRALGSAIRNFTVLFLGGDEIANALIALNVWNSKTTVYEFRKIASYAMS